MGRGTAQAVARSCPGTGADRHRLRLNLGDSYSTHAREGADRKSLLLGPERLALRLIEDGWIIRNKIVWAKTNTIPTSVRDRLATKHEVIYVLARQAKYYFDLDAIRVPHSSRPPKPRRDQREGRARAGSAPTATATGASTRCTRRASGASARQEPR